MENDLIYRDLFDLGLKFETRLIEDYFNSYRNGMSYLQCRVFDRICVKGCTNARDLSEHFDLPKQHMSLIIEKLENTGLVLRKRSEQDRRYYDILPTSEGKACYEEHLKRSYEHYTSMTACLTQEERERFSSCVSELNSLFDQIERSL